MTPWTRFDVVAVDAQTMADLIDGEAALRDECAQLGLAIEYFDTCDHGRTRLYRVLHDANA